MFSLIVSHIGRFDPRPREGSDKMLGNLTSSWGRFDPRPREGSDPRVWKPRRFPFVSIHAPVKGATSVANDATMATMFRSTPP